MRRTKTPASSRLRAIHALKSDRLLEHVLDALLADEGDAASYRLMLIDVRNYDQIFNTLGPEITQRLPAAVAARLRERFSAHGQVYHVHTGKIAALAHGHDDSAAGHAGAITELLGYPVEVDGVPIYLDAVAGIASLRGVASGPGGALRRANIALDGARRSGLAIGYYEDFRSRGRKQTLRLLGDAPEALDANQFQLVYQPQIRLSDERIVGAEALIRWQHPTLGLLPPGRFIPLLEETTLINRLTGWVARNAVAQAAEWQHAGLKIQVAFNVSPRNLENPQLAHVILEEIRRQEVAPDRIELELTESAIIRDTGIVRRVLDDLKVAGIGLALDDFGDGYTSVRNLTALPIDKLKIDRSLVDGIISDTRRQRIVSAITHLANDLGLCTVAEGIEDRETANYFNGQGCDVAQGYYYSRPVSPADLARQYREAASYT